MTSPIALTLAVVLFSFAKSVMAAESSTPAATAGTATETGASGPSETARGSPARSQLRIPSRLTGAASLTRSNSLYNRMDGTEEASVDASLQLSYNRKSWGGSMLVEASQDLRRPENSDLTAFVLNASRKNLKVYRDILLVKPSLALSLPVSRDQRLRQSLIAGATASLRVELDPDKTSHRRVNLASSLSVTRNFHTYEQKTNGSLNTQYSSKQGADLTFLISEKISISMALAHLDTFSYAGGHRESYTHSEELGIEIFHSTNFTLGHQLGGSIRKANGEDYNFQLTDDNQSIVYASLSKSF
jgi:hypothetical protein